MYHIAQVNIARALAPLNDPRLADFFAHLDQIYTLAESSPGFIWRLRTEDISPTSTQLPADERLFATVSVWDSLESLKTFTYTDAHAQIMRRRREWFIKLNSPYIALWWIPAGHIPDLAEVTERMDHLRAHGPSPFAFSFTHTFPAPDEESHPVIRNS